MPTKMLVFNVVLWIRGNWGRGRNEGNGYSCNWLMVSRSLQAGIAFTRVGSDPSPEELVKRR